MSTTNANFHWGHREFKVESYWSDLPADLLRKISKKLHDICDFVCFRSICKSWRALTTISDLPPQVPWLLDMCCEARDSEYLHFRALFSDNKIHTIHCPQSRGKQPDGLLHGYLYIRENDEMHSLINPLIKHEVALQFKPDLLMKYEVAFPFKPNSRHYLICSSTELTKDNDYMMFMNCIEDPVGRTSVMEFYQPHKSKKGYIKEPIGSSNRKGITTNITHACLKGMFFTHDTRTCNTNVFDIARDSTFVIPPPEIHSNKEDVFFVESEENILRIVKNFKWDRSSEESDGEYVTDIYRLDIEDKNGQYRWIKIDGIGNQILFLDCSKGNNSGISIRTSESTELMKNCIYILENYGIYKYDIKSSRTQRVLRLAEMEDLYTWFVPSLVAFPVAS